MDASWEYDGEALFASVADHLQARGWSARVCAYCSRPFMAAAAQQDCQSPECTQAGGQRICPAGSANRRASAAKIWAQLRSYFTERDHAERRLDDLRNDAGEPLFIIAAIQNFDDVIYGGAEPPSGPFIIGQPSIRMRYFDEVTHAEGIGTSFVNVGTYQFGLRPVDYYLDHLDNWLAALVRVGLAPSGFTLTLEQVSFDAGPYFGRYLLINHGGIELGEAILISSARTADGRRLAMVDFGLGLERILWAVTGTQAYWRNVGPPIVRLTDNPLLIDSLRTSVLMAMSGIAPEHRGRGYRLRRSVARLADTMGTLDISDMVRRCHAEWSVFISPLCDWTECHAVIEAEINRHNRLTLARRLGIKEHQALRHADASSLIEHLLADGASIDKLCDEFNGPGRRAHVA